MFPQAKWFGLSLALHLAAVAGLIFVASHNVGQTPKVIMVTLDYPAPTEIPLSRGSHVLTPAAVRTSAPARSPKPTKPELTRQPLQAPAPEVPPTTPVPEQNRAAHLTNASPEIPLVSNTSPRIEGAIPAPLSQTVRPVQHAAATAEKRPVPEKIQQRYMKEHFAYIRDLITKQLVYPPMARKMRWSGKVVVAFFIAEDGSAHAIRVAETSGFPILDKSALETVRNVAPFPKPPVRAEIVVPINFKMMQ